MTITKYEHACFDIKTKQGRVIIDPGIFTKKLNNFNNLSAVVITHVHSDHFNKEIIKKIIGLNPKAKIFTNSQVASELSDYNVTVVSPGKIYNIDDITLEFFGQKHELFNDILNVGVLVNNEFYYGGDSYTLPNKPVTVLAAPMSAPWLRVSEAGQYIKNVGAKQVIPAHNILLSDQGKSIHYRILSSAITDSGEFKNLEPSEQIKI